MEICQACEKPFKVFEYHLGMPGTKEREPITCPYCQHTIERVTNGLWNTSPLSDEEQKEFLKKNLLNEDKD